MHIKITVKVKKDDFDLTMETSGECDNDVADFSKDALKRTVGLIVDDMVGEAKRFGKNQKE